MRLRKADRELLATIDTRIEDGELFDEQDGKLRKAWSSFFERVLADDKKREGKVTGYPVRDAIKAISGVLRGRAITPAGSPGQVFFIPLQNRINASGLTEDLIVKAAKQAAKEWRGRIRVESVIRQADDLLSKGNGDGEHPSAEAPRRDYLEDL
jgi:nucleoid-associated protein YgaU